MGHQAFADRGVRSLGKAQGWDVEIKCLHLSNNGELSSELLVNHKSKDSHHGGTSVVQLNGTLLKLGLFRERVPSEVKGSVTEVSNELSLSGNILHDEKLKESNEEKDLKGSILGHLEGSSPSVSNIREFGSIKGDGSRKVDSSTGDDVSKEGKLANTSVLQLNVTKTVETSLAGLVEHTQRIEESKWGLGTKFILEGVDGSGGLGNRCRGEGRGGGNAGGDEERLVHGG